MPMYNLIEYSDNYLKTSGSLWQYCKEIPAVGNTGLLLILMVLLLLIHLILKQKLLIKLRLIIIMVTLMEEKMLK